MNFYILHCEQQLDLSPPEEVNSRPTARRRTCRYPASRHGVRRRKKHPALSGCGAFLIAAAILCANSAEAKPGEFVPDSTRALDAPHTPGTTAPASTDNLPCLGEDLEHWEKRAGKPDKTWGKDASLDSEERHYPTAQYSVGITVWHGKIAALFVTKSDNAAFGLSEIQKVLTTNAGMSSWHEKASTPKYLQWLRQDEKAFVRYELGECKLRVMWREYTQALVAHNEAAIVAPAAGSLSRSEWRARLRKYCTIPSGHQLLSNEKRLFAVMGKPDDVEHEGRNTYWYYKCSDGVVQLAFQLDPEMMGGQIIAEVSDR